MTFKTTVKKFAKQFMTEYVTTPQEAEYLKEEGFTLVTSESFVKSYLKEIKDTNDYWKEIIKFKKDSINKYGEFDLENEEEVKDAELNILQEEIDKLFTELTKAA